MRRSAAIASVVIAGTGGVAHACPVPRNEGADLFMSIIIVGTLLGSIIAIAFMTSRSWTPSRKNLRPTSADVARRLAAGARRHARNWFLAGVTLVTLASVSHAPSMVAGVLAGLTFAALPMWWRAACLTRSVDAADAVCELGGGLVVVTRGPSTHWLCVGAAAIARCETPAIPSARIVSR